MGTEVGSAVEILEPLLPPEKIPPWREQITVRGLLVSTLLGALFCIITHKLNLTVGVIPSLNVAAGLLGFFFIKSWTELASRIGLSAKPFTRQENTVIQTCVVACYGLAFSDFTLTLVQHMLDAVSSARTLLIALSFLELSYLGVSFGRSSPQKLGTDDESSKLLMEERLRNETFVKDSIPSWFAASGYVGLATISTAVIPNIFPQMRWYLVLACYIVAPALAFCNSYGTGLTDWSLASTYGKIGLFVFASLVGSKGGVIAGLAACGVMMSIVSTAADLMQDFKTGYLTLSSPRSMFVSQLIGTALGCIIAPLTFWLYWTAFDVGAPDGVYKAPYAVIYREMAILGVEGFSALPKHCLELCCVFFVAALVINLMRDVTPKNVSSYIPIPMAMAVPFYIGAYFAIDMFIGTVVLYVWERLNRSEAEDYAGAVASGLICGDGIWIIPSAILSIFRIDPPICMYFTPSS
ncbi:hypothetical protein B296_00038556 [Ensete ventricosum]|uniref:Metal-nicotianamine transporter YSL6 n=1 Tax=Ensete ventricosum TaxID=4639 RepID=A0A426ZMA5_ENSVE|nr:hypothetical protein B296_00038556 [Ensete ventricosum]